MRLTALLAALMLAACAPDPAPSADPIDAGAAASAARTDFAITTAAPETYQGRPALKIEFTQPLAPAQPFDDRIHVTGPGGATQSGSWVLADDSRALLFPFVDGNAQYRVQLSADLEAADGRRLGEVPALDIHSGNLPPRLGFASQGSVLPASGSEGLPVIGVNAPEADVEFFRVRPSEYSNFFARWQNQGQRGWWQLGELARLADSVYSNRFALAGRANERAVSHLPVQSIAELREPGLYFAVMRRPGDFDGRFEVSHYMVSDLGLHVRAYPERLWVHVASLASGRPRGSVQIDVLDERGQRVAGGGTDARGSLELAYRSHPAHVVVARVGRELSILPLRQPALDLAEFEVGGRAFTALDAYLWSGRDLYRPGETLQVSALLRDHSGALPGQAPPLFAVLKQPDGREIVRRVLEPGALGHYAFEQAIAADAPTGRWTLELRSDPGNRTGAANGPALGQFGFRVEEFLPERLKLTLESALPRLAPGEGLPLSIDGAYLYGAPASGNRFTADLLYRVAVHPVPSRPDYHFGDPTVTLPDGPQAALDVRLPSDGRLQHTFELSPEQPLPPTPVEVRVAASLFESGGRAVRRSLARVAWPAEQLVGVRPMFDLADGADVNSTVGFEVIRSDAEGGLSAATLEVELVREHRDWRWTWVDGSGWNADFTRREVIEERTSLTLDGQRPARLALRVEWGEYRLQIRDPETGLITRLPFRAGWSWEDRNRGLDARPDRVKLALDRTGYRAGDRVTVTITPPQAGPGVLLVESDRLLHSQAIDVRAGTEVALQVAPEWERHDVYITVLVFRPAGTGEGAGPQRAVGIAHLPIARAQQAVELSVATPELVRPGETIAIELHAPALAGREARVVVDAVDQGILSLTGYPLPDAIAYFLARRALGVEARDVYGRVIEMLAGTRARLRYGGDAAVATLPQARRPTARVQTVALHSGAVAVGADGRARVEFTAPDFNGALRVAALAFSADSYGRADGETIVRAPLVLEVSTPRVMAPEDSARLAVDLQNLSGRAQRYRVRAEAGELLEIARGEREVELADGARTTLDFPLRALPGHGVGRFAVHALPADGAPLSREFELVVRPAWPAERRGTLRAIDGGGDIALSPAAVDGWFEAASELQLSLSSVPPIPFVGAAKGLIGFPMGCIEQTTSRMWPLVLLDEATAARYRIDLSPAERERRIAHGFARIAAMQMPSGQFGFWPGEGHPDPQMTPVVAELLLVARDAGITIPQAVLDRALTQLNDELLAGGSQYWAYDFAEHVRFSANAHAAYVLARAGRAPLGALRAMYDHERGKTQTGLPLLRLGLALRLQGDGVRGDAAIAEAIGFDGGRRPLWLGDYGSPLRDEAMMLALLHEHGLATAEHDARLVALARELRAGERRDWGLSTQEQLALFRLGRQLLTVDAAPLAGVLDVGGRRIELPDTHQFSLAITGEELRRGARLQLATPTRVWIAEDAVGAPRRPPTPVAEGLDVRRGWYRMDGSRFDGGVLREGETLIVRLAVQADQSIPDALITDLLPGGLEVENINLGDTDTLNQLVIDGQSLSERHWAAEIRHEEYRDDRYTAAVKLWPGQVARLYYLARAVSPGRYVVPPPFVEDMYRPSLRSIGRAEPERIEVLPPAN